MLNFEAAFFLGELTNLTFALFLDQYHPGTKTHKLILQERRLNTVVFLKSPGKKESAGK